MHADAVAQRRALTTLRKTRRLRSDGRNRSRVRDQHLRLAEEQEPVVVEREVEAGARIRACVSALKYMSVLRQTSRSMREIGASWTRSLRPKITARRRSLRNVKRWSARSK